MAMQQTNGTTAAEKTVGGYLGDLIAVVKHVSEAVARHADNDKLARIAGARGVIEQADRALKRQLAELESHAKSIGGTGAMGAIKESITSMTGFVTGLYGTMRGETASRIVRDDATGVGFVLTCTQMLHTTALAVGDQNTASLMANHIRALPGVVMALNALLPHAVVADLGADHVPISNAHAAEDACRDYSEAWRASEAAGV